MLVLYVFRQNIIEVIKFRRMKCAGHVARMIEITDAYNFSR
jgi:hypothetical protein